MRTLAAVLFLTVFYCQIVLAVEPLRIAVRSEVIAIALPEYEFGGFYWFKSRAFFIDAGLQYGSNAINNNFASKFYYKNAIETSDKDLVTKHLIATNRLGLQTNASINYSFYSHKDSGFLKNTCWTFSLQNRQWVDAKFGADAFEFLFRGNAMFAGKKAVLGNSSLTQLAYNQYQVGLAKTFNKKGINHQFYLNVALLQGSQYNKLDLTKADVFTESLGKYIDVDYQFKVDRADTSSGAAIAKWNGTGASISGGVRLKKGFWQLNLGWSDLGAIKFNSNVIHYKADSSIHFQGLILEDIFTSKTQAAANSGRIDSLNQLLFPKTSGENFTVKLPLLLKGAISYKNYSLGFWNLFNSHALPYIYLKARFNKQLAYPKNQLVIEPQVAYGGYGRFHIGTAVGFRHQNYAVQLLTDDLQAVIPKSATSLSLAVKAYYLF